VVNADNAAVLGSFRKVSPATSAEGSYAVRGLFNTQAKHRVLPFVIDIDSQLGQFVHCSLGAFDSFAMP
jgi:hypothetical protein